MEVNLNQIPLGSLLPYDSESVDTLELTSSLNFSSKKEIQVFSNECLRVLKPQGKLTLIFRSLKEVLRRYQAVRNCETIPFGESPKSPLGWLEKQVNQPSLLYPEKIERIFHQFSLHRYSDPSEDDVRFTCQKPDNPLCSVVLSTRNKADYLDLTLASIFAQEVPFEYETVVVDDGSTDNTKDVCDKYPVRYYHLDNHRYRNPSVARNVGYRAARGKVIIAQSDDIIHVSPNTIEYLATDLKQGEFLLANVQNYKYENGEPKTWMMEYCGPIGKSRRPYFFLGSLWKEDLYSIGGSDEDFVEPCFDDNWFADCLMSGLKLKPRFTDQIKGNHQSHPHGSNTHSQEHLSKELYERKTAEAKKTGVYQASGGPWTDNDPRLLASPGQVVTTQKLPRRGEITANGRIPRCMNFFWAGNKLSWMRYLTLHSFRFYHPDWQIVLHRTSVDGGKKWASSETQDSQTYHGPDYSDRIQNLDIETRPWVPPVQGLAPAHASDLCQWDILKTDGGFYADMDILFVKAIPYDNLQNTDAVFCLSLGFMAIGFFGASPNNPLFRKISKEARKGYKGNAYQSTGAEAVYRLGGLGTNWGKVDNPGDLTLTELHRQFPNLLIRKINSETVYPWTYRQTDHIFSATNSITDKCFGIHWFGGNALSQEWNNTLTEMNFGNYENTFTKYAQQCLSPKGQDK